ncbi:hypothetical protein LXL04_034326 [Taraxacum kok-saghyz]
MPPKNEATSDAPFSTEQLQALIHLNTATNHALTHSLPTLPSSSSSSPINNATNHHRHRNHTISCHDPLICPYQTLMGLTRWIGFFRPTTILINTTGQTISASHSFTKLLFKLKQTSTAYQAEFEKLSNCVDDSTPIHNPTTLHQTYGLAKLSEKTLFFNKPRQTFSRTYPLSFFTSTIVTPTALPKLAIKPPLITNPPPKPTVPFTRFSPIALQKRLAEGRCFLCPEKYGPRHKCNHPQFIMIVDNHDGIDTDLNPPTDEPIADLSGQINHFLSLSAAAFLALLHPKLYESLATLTTLKLPQEDIPSFPIMVENGDFCNMMVWHGLALLGPSILISQLCNSHLILGPPPDTPTNIHSMIHKCSVASLHALYFELEPHSYTINPTDLHHPEPTITTLL